MTRAIAIAALAALATPAAAQDTATLCGGLGAQGTWINGAQQAADLATLDAPVDQLALLPQDRIQVSLFSLSVPADVRLEASPQMGGDTEIELRDAAGNMIAVDDDGGGGLASRIEMPLGAGTYCLVTRGLGGSAVSADVRIGLAAHVPLTDVPAAAYSGAPEPCTASTPATALDTGTLADGFVATAPIAGNPYYRFVLDAPESITLTAENVDADPVLMLYDSTGQLLAENDDFDGLNSRIDMPQPLAAGSYCVGLRALGDATVPVTVTLKRFDSDEALRGLYARGEASPPLDGPVPITALGTLQGRQVKDVMIGADAAWFSVDVPAGGLLLVEAASLGSGDPEVSLFDAMGAEVGRDDDGAGNLNSRLAVRAGPGSYMIGLRDFGGGTSSAMRLSIERFVPAD